MLTNQPVGSYIWRDHFTGTILREKDIDESLLKVRKGKGENLFFRMIINFVDTR